MRLIATLEVNSKPAGERLRVLGPLGGEEGEVGRFEADQDPPPQGEEEAAAGTRDAEVLALQDERVGVRQDREPSAAEAEEGADGPARREVDGDAAAVKHLRAVGGERGADEAVERHGLVDDDLWPRLEVAEAAARSVGDRDREAVAVDREAAVRPLVRRSCC